MIDQALLMVGAPERDYGSRQGYPLCDNAFFCRYFKDSRFSWKQMSMFDVFTSWCAPVST